MSFPSIAIIGGGLGGLALARVLLSRNIPFTLYEAESSATIRSQGGTLDMHEHSGQKALQLAGLFDGFKKVARPEDDSTRIVNKHNALLLEQAGGGDRPEVDRGRLRDLLLGGFDGLEQLKWNHKVVKIEPNEADGPHTLFFADGSHTTVDLVIGADGTWSKVRPLLSSAQPEYTGVSFVEAIIRDVDRRPDVAKAAGRGTISALDDNKCIILQRTGAGDVRIYIGLRAPLGCADELLGASAPGLPPARTSAERDAARAAAVSRILDAFTGWSPEILSFVKAADGPLIPRPLFALPTGHSWLHRRGLTLLGDAAHVMSPFAGEGANLAMIDGADLAVAIAESGPDGWDDAVAVYEQKMQTRAARSAEESASNLNIFISEGGAQAAADMFQKMIAEHMAQAADGSGHGRGEESGAPVNGDHAASQPK